MLSVRAVLCCLVLDRGVKIALGECRIVRSGSDIFNDDVSAHFVECIAVGSGGHEKWKNLPPSGQT